MRSFGSSGRPRPSAPRVRGLAGRLMAPRAFACVALLGAAACTAEPSYQLQWRIVDTPELGYDQAAELVAIDQCAQTGIVKLEVTTRTAGGTEVDVRRYPCFPGAFADGQPTDGPPELEPGEYVLDVVGLRRTDEPWVCAEDDVDCVAQASATVTVSEGSLPTVSFVLLRPPECDDGVDNDKDGRVDGKDPACALDPTGPESAEAEQLILDMRVRLLESPVVELANVNANRVELTLDGETIQVLTQNDLSFVEGWYELPLYSSDQVEPGLHTLALVAYDLAGVARTEPLTFEFEMGESALYSLIDFEVSADRFVEPLVEPLSLFANLLPYPDATLGSALICELNDAAATPVDQVRLRVRDTAAGDAFLDAAALGLNVAAEDLADGWVGLPCTIAPALASAPLTWGNYAVEAEAYVGGARCFADARDHELGPTEGLAPLAPLGLDSPQLIDLERVYVDGAPPEGCRECTPDADDDGPGDDECANPAHECVNFLCVP